MLLKEVPGPDGVVDGNYAVSVEIGSWIEVLVPLLRDLGGKVVDDREVFRVDHAVGVVVVFPAELLPLLVLDPLGLDRSLLRRGAIPR